MPEELETLTLGENELRLETLALPNGNTYILGCSFEEAQEIYQVLSENIEAVNDDVEKNEKVTSAALNDLNSRIGTLSDDVEALQTSGEDVTEALTALGDRVDDLEEDVDGLKESEEVAAAAFNDLNSRIGTLSSDVEELQTSGEHVSETLESLDDRVGDLEDFADDAEKTEKVISTSLNDLNQRIVSLTQENASLRSDITALQQEIAAIKRTYMSYYDVNASTGIGEQNTYSTT